MKNLNKADIAAVITALLGLLMSINVIGPDEAADIEGFAGQVIDQLGEFVLVGTGLIYMISNRFGTDNETG